MSLFLVPFLLLLVAGFIGGLILWAKYGAGSTAKDDEL